MANYTLSRLGAVNSTTGTEAQNRALMLKVFSGEVLASFRRTQVTMGRHMVRTISSGE